MKRSILRWASALLMAAGLATQVHADSIINNFTGSYDYVLNGIIGDTNWDGVYLNFGDIPFGGAGGSGNGAALQANTTFAGGFLTVQSTGSDWAGNGDDGIYLWKLVSGDFDVSVQSAPLWQNQNNNFAGLLIRAWNTNQSGAPISFNTTNASENYLQLWRDQQFAGAGSGGGQLRQSTNGTDIQYNLGGPGDPNDTTTPRYYRITRIGDQFTFYVKTNQGDAWFEITNAANGAGYVRTNGGIARPDWHNQPVQVGIAQAVFARPGAPASDFFTDFELSGPSVSLGTPTLPGTPSNLITTATNINGLLTFSWTPGNSGDSSLVVMRRSGNIQINPIQGLTYPANAGFGSSNALIGGSEYVVYNGTGNSVTVSNLSANIFNYSVAVFEYTNNGTGNIYNTATPVTNSFAGPGVINSAYIGASFTNVPLNGASDLRLLAAFSTGETNFDQTAFTTWSSSDPTIAPVDGNGAVSGVSSGKATITATFGTFTPTIDINVTTPFAFMDNFSSTNDYVLNGIVNSEYDGLFLNFGDVPGTINSGGDGAGFTVALDSQTTTTNGLYMSSVQSDWEGTADDGPFLFKIVPGTNNAVSGDFQASVHINNMNILNGSVAGLMARLYAVTNGGRGPGNAENHVNYWKVQNGTTSARVTQAGGLTTLFGAGPAAADGWMMIQRANSTNFLFFERATTNDTWIFMASVVLAQASNNAPMEVGVANQANTGVNGVATFDSFNLDAAGIVSATPVPVPATNLTMTLNGDLSMTLNWVAKDGSGNPIPSLVVMRQGAVVSAQPPVGSTLNPNTVFGQGSNLGGGNYVVFVSANPPASINNTVTVTGLTLGQTYYATVFTYAGAGANRVINSAGVSSTLLDASITNIVVSVAGGIPKGGINTVTVQGASTAGPIPISTVGATYTSDNTNIIQIFAGVLTGVTNGTANISVVLGGFSNSTPVTVRAPSFADNFDVQHDYLVDGVTNTAWDGSYNITSATNPIPGSTYAPLLNSGTTFASSPNTNIVVTGTNVVGTTTNLIYSTNVVPGLNVQGSGDGWENGNSGGFFLFKYVPGNFQMAVHIQSFQVAAFNQPGILARGYAISNSVIGYPMGYAIKNAGGTNDAGEYWVDLTRFDEFGIGTYVRRNLDGLPGAANVVSQNTQTDQGDGNFWLLIIRSGDGSQFDFYKRAAITDPWRQVPSKQHYSIAQFSGKPMQVGVMAGDWNGTSTTPLPVVFDSFMLDTTSGTTLKITPSGSNLIVSWPNFAGTLEHTTTLSPPNWQTVPGTPVLGLTGYSITVPATPGANDFFRLRQ